MVAPVELVRSLLTDDWSDDYAASDHWSRYWNAVSAPSDDDWPEGLTEDGDKFFLKDKLLVPENRTEELIDHWHNAQLMHPGRDKMQQDLEFTARDLDSDDEGEDDDFTTKTILTDKPDPGTPGGRL